jgi:hypothetical protein
MSLRIRNIVSKLFNLPAITAMIVISLAGICVFFVQLTKIKKHKDLIEQTEAHKTSLKDSIELLLIKSSVDDRYFQKTTPKYRALYEQFAESPFGKNWIDARLQFIVADSTAKAQSKAAISRLQTENSEQKSELDQKTNQVNSLRRAQTSLQARLDSLAIVSEQKSRDVDSLLTYIDESRKGRYIVTIQNGKDQVFYIGDMKDGMAEGYGVGLFSTGGRYEGQWKENMRHGEGRYEWSDGEYFVGNYANDKRHGYGEYFFKNGKKYEGFWLDSKRHGYGRILSKAGKIEFQGLWENDHFIKSATEAELADNHE